MVTSVKNCKNSCALSVRTPQCGHNWLVVWNIFVFHILEIVIPIDFHIFQRGSNHQPDNVWVKQPIDTYSTRQMTGTGARRCLDIWPKWAASCWCIPCWPLRHRLDGKCWWWVQEEDCTESYNISICSMYGICTNMCHKNRRKEGRYIIHGAYGNWIISDRL